MIDYCVPGTYLSRSVFFFFQVNFDRGSVGFCIPRAMMSIGAAETTVDSLISKLLDTTPNLITTDFL